MFKTMVNNFTIKELENQIKMVESFPSHCIRYDELNYMKDRLIELLENKAKGGQS